LLWCERAGPPDGPRERRSLQVLEQQMGAIAPEHRSEAADDDRMCQPVEELGLTRQGPECVLVAHEVGTDELRDDERVKMLVPHEVDLVVPAAAYRLEREPPGDNLLTLGERPALTCLSSRLLAPTLRHGRNLPLARVVRL
jgi:hypothetical protein